MLPKAIFGRRDGEEKGWRGEGMERDRGMKKMKDGEGCMNLSCCLVRGRES